MPKSVCGVGTYIASDGGATADKTCVMCDGTTSYSNSTDATSCYTMTACYNSYFILTAGTVSSDRICYTCPASTYAFLDSSLYPPSVTVDKLCIPISDCGVGTFVAQNFSATSDRTCQNCSYGFYENQVNQPSCKPKKICHDGEYVFSIGSTSVDTICLSCELGIDYQDQLDQYQCKKVSDCPAQTYVAALSTLSSDRVCVPCAKGFVQPNANQLSCYNATAADTGSSSSSTGSNGKKATFSFNAFAVVIAIMVLLLLLLIVVMLHKNNKNMMIIAAMSNGGGHIAASKVHDGSVYYNPTFSSGAASAVHSADVPVHSSPTVAESRVGGRAWNSHVEDEEEEGNYMTVLDANS